MEETYQEYLAKFEELKAMDDYEQAHVMADELLMHITWEVYHRRLSYNQIVELHKMYEGITKHYA